MSPSASPSAARTPRDADRTRRAWGVLLLILGVLGPLAAPLWGLAGAAGAAPQRRALEGDQLSVVLDEVPTSIPTTAGPERVFTISGTVTNQSDEQWSAINLYMFNAATPILDSADLAASVAQDPGEYFGDRVTAPGTFWSIESLTPGQSARFTISATLDQMHLAGAAAGVYSVGVHAIGDSSEPRDLVADGRARTFVPVVDPSGPASEVSVVVPVRGDVWFTAEGSVGRLALWRRSLAPGGRLHSLLDVADAEASVTWLVDPAVLAAVSRLAAGNPGRSLAPVPDPAPTATATPTPSGSQTAGGTTELSWTPVHPELDEGAELSGSQGQLAQLASTWLDGFREAVQGADLLALPYGDVDVSAAARHRGDIVAQSLERSAEVMELLELPARVAVAPRNGLLSPEALAAVPEGTLIVVADTAFALAPTAPAAVLDLDGHTAVLTSAAAASGGPGPTEPHEALALRQRIASEAALRRLAGDPTPVVVVLPTQWRPAHSGDLVRRLERDWLSTTTVRSLSMRQGTPAETSDLTYSESDVDHELPEYVFSRAAELTGSASLFDDVLTGQTTLVGQVRDEVFASLSQARRNNPQGSAMRLSETTRVFTDQLAQVQVEVPRSVTLTSASGTIGATIVNGIDQPITVRITSESDEGLEVVDADEVEVDAGARHRLLLEVKATRQGRHDVYLLVTSKNGIPLGSRTALPLRSSIISDKVWGALAAGAIVLFVAVTYRIVRRIRRVRSGDPVRPPLPDAASDEQ